MLIEVGSEKELIECARQFGCNLKRGDVIVLNGPLGAGKTTFVKGIAKALEIISPITSPTYTITKLYDQKLCHVDSYRIFDEDIGLEELKEQGYIICVEWAENISEYLPQINYMVDIEYTLQGRKVKIETKN